MGNDPADQIKCTTQFCRLLSVEDNPMIQNVIDAGMVPRFVQFLKRDDNSALQLEATWALANIVLGTSDQIKAVIDCGAVPIFVRLLSSSKTNDDVRSLAMSALGKLIFILFYFASEYTINLPTIF